MGTIMGMGSSHWPAMIQPDEAKPWPFLRTLANDPRVPAELKNPLNWPEGVRAEWGQDEGVSAHREHRRRLVEAFRKLRKEIQAFAPDFILMFGDDQYENFTEDIIPPFCVMAFADLTSHPFKGGVAVARMSGTNPKTTRSRCGANRTSRSGSPAAASKKGSTCRTPIGLSTGRDWATPSSTSRCTWTMIARVSMCPSSRCR